MSRRITIATTQYTVGTDREANLLAILQRIDEAADHGADLVLFPEFCNHVSLYRDQEHCWEVAVDEEGPWVGAIRERARARRIWVAFNASTRGPRPTVYDQNYLIDRDGRIVATVRKKVLIGGENDFMTKDQIEPEVFDTELGRIGFTTCMDGVLPETARTVALKGAQIILDSLNSNARDEGALHVPVRAAENGVFMVSSCKSGPLIPLELFDGFRNRVPMEEHLIHAPGESQIVDPRGRVLAKGGWRTDEIVYAAIDPTEADEKRLPGLGDLLADRRPELYGVLALPNEQLPLVLSPSVVEVEPFTAAAIQTESDPTVEYAILRGLDVAEEAADRGARLIVLPELYPFQEGTVAANPRAAALASREAAARLAALAAKRDLHLVASLVEEADGRFYHTTFLWSPAGEVTRYRQVHVREPDRVWATPGDRFVTADTALGRIGLLAGYDGLFVESARVLACMGADMIAYSTCWRIEWEPRLALRERAAENHLTIVAANRADSPVARGAIIATVPRFPTPWRGRLNPVDLTESSPGIETFVRQTVDPVASRNKLMVPKTDAIFNRRAELHGPLVARR
ncbi:MAG: carbon-nitrogen hydrolase family protein [Chloroflexota bacterium]|nr:carbon-nitrogen hydrolase family protein [Dehalococcoidia bacterium]MDW8253694.1 carbon-nitrogen hydrolase family protein [Chloroflexota bacterium]